MPDSLTTTEFKLTNEHISIMEHTRDRAAGGYYCGDSREMQELVDGGLMAFAGRKSFVPWPYFQLTGKGREALRAPRGMKTAGGPAGTITGETPAPLPIP